MINREHGRMRFAPIGKRMLACLLDYAIICGYLLVLVGVSFAAKPWLSPLFARDAVTAELAGFDLLTLPVCLYFAISECSKAQATWGKRKMGLVVADVRGRRIGFGRSCLRSAVKLFPWELAHFTVWHMVLPSSVPDFVLYPLLAAVYGFVFAYLISPFIVKTNQSVYDLLAKTVVLHKAQSGRNVGSPFML